MWVLQERSPGGDGAVGQSFAPRPLVSWLVLGPREQSHQHPEEATVHVWEDAELPRARLVFSWKGVLSLKELSLILGKAEGRFR